MRVNVNWRRVLRRLAADAPHPRATPFTFWYLALLLVSTIMLRLVSTRTADALLRWSSTSAVNLHRHPIGSLIASALWVDGRWWPYLIAFSVVLAPVERRIGSLRTILVFLSGHVIATLVTELPVGWQVRHNLLPRAMARLTDIGVSYGFATGLGVFVLMLPTKARWVVGVLAELVVLGAVAADVTVTSVGHACALQIGLFGWLAWVRRRGLLGALGLVSGRTGGSGRLRSCDRR